MADRARRITAGALEGISLPPRGGGAPRRFLVALHGYGGDASELLPVVASWMPSLDDDVEAFLPEAPAPCAMNRARREWFPLTGQEDVLRDRIATTSLEIAGLLAWIRATHGVSPRHVALVGFSQGAMLALQAGLACAVGAVVAFSGLLTSAADGLAPVPPPAVFFGHGARDRMVPPARAERAAELVARWGGPVRLHVEPELGHAVSPAAAIAARDFVREHLARAPGRHFEGLEDTASDH
jgi:phospholipase/carboxylesterase